MPMKLVATDNQMLQRVSRDLLLYKQYHIIYNSHMEEKLKNCLMLITAMLNCTYTNEAIIY